MFPSEWRKPSCFFILVEQMNNVNLKAAAIISSDSDSLYVAARGADECKVTD